MLCAPLKDSWIARSRVTRTQRSIWPVSSSSSKHPQDLPSEAAFNLAVRDQDKGQEVNSPVTRQKTSFGKLPEENRFKPTLDRVDQVDAYWTIE